MISHVHLFNGRESNGKIVQATCVGDYGGGGNLVFCFIVFPFGMLRYFKLKNEKTKRELDNMIIPNRD